MAENGADAAPSDLEKKIIRQIEYYFGDANLGRDRFLQTKIKEDNGWVPLDTMIKFNRLQSLSSDFDVITAAMSKSTSGLMEVSEDKLKIRRSTEKPLPNNTTENLLEIKKRTVYCKGFSTDDDTLDSIQQFLDQFGTVESIQMRKDKERQFKGSVFATFEKEEYAQKFLETKDLKIGETDAIKMLKDDYYKLKTEERKEKREEEKKEKQLVREKQEQEAIEAQQVDFGEFEKGCVMHFAGVSEQTSREDLKELFGEYGSISWVEFERGQTEGCVRFDDDVKAEDVIQKAKAANDGKLVIRELELTVRVLEGEEEEQHWKSVYEQKTKIRLRKKMSSHGYGRGRKFKSRGRDGGRDERRPGRTKFEGKKTVFDDPDEEGGHMDAEEEKDVPEKKEEKEVAVAEEPSSTEKPLVVKESAAAAAGDTSAADKTPKMEVQVPESTTESIIKTAEKRPLEETSEAEPASKVAKSAE